MSAVKYIVNPEWKNAGCEEIILNPDKSINRYWTDVVAKRFSCADLKNPIPMYIAIEESSHE